MKVRRTLIISGILLGISFLLQILARQVPGFGQWYAVTIYPFFVNTYARFMSLFPFCVLEWVVIAGILWVLFLAVRGILRAVKKKESVGRMFANGGLFVLLVVSILFCMLTVLCSVNYYRDEFSKVAGFEIRTHSTEELRELCVSLAEEVNAASRQVERDEEGNLILPEDTGEEAMKAMENLGRQYEALSGYYPRPKKVLFGDVMSYQSLMGLYSAFTLESMYNGDMMTYNVPDTMCHELSHMKGFMREDEANFIAYLACRESGNPVLQYSGAMNAFVYATNQLYAAAGSEVYAEIFSLVDEKPIQELAKNDAFWQQFEGPVKEVSQAANDAYLKANDQEDGMKSYGRMVDLLLAEYFDQAEE